MGRRRGKMCELKSPWECAGVAEWNRGGFKEWCLSWKVMVVVIRMGQEGERKRDFSFSFSNPPQSKPCSSLGTSLSYFINQEVGNIGRVVEGKSTLGQERGQEPTVSKQVTIFAICEFVERVRASSSFPQLCPGFQWDEDWREEADMPLQHWWDFCPCPQIITIFSISQKAK